MQWLGKLLFWVKSSGKRQGTWRSASAVILEWQREVAASEGLSWVPRISSLVFGCQATWCSSTRRSCGAADTDFQMNKSFEWRCESKESRRSRSRQNILKYILNQWKNIKNKCCSARLSVGGEDVALLWRWGSDYGAATWAAPTAREQGGYQLTRWWAEMHSA